MLNRIKLRLLTFQSLLHKVDGGIPVLLALPWFLLLVNQSWIFSPVSIDPWLYWGYFNNFGKFIEVFAGTYYGTRLPWIVPGYICYKIFPPLVANYVLHVGFYYIAVFSLYFIMKQTVGKRGALLTSVLMGCYPFFLSAIGWDYIDGAGIAYFLLTILLLTLAARSSRESGWTFLIQRNGKSVSLVTKISLWTASLLCMAGASLAAFIYTNTFLLLFVPIVVLYFIIINRRHQKHPLVTGLFFALVGFAACTVVLACINQVAGGSLFFFLPSFSFAWYMLSHPNPWLVAGYSWLKIAFWLVLPSLVFLSSLLFLIYNWFKRVARPKSPLFKPATIFSLCFVLTFLIMLLSQLRGNPVLQLTYYASYLLPGMFLAAGALISPLLEKVSGRQFFWLVGSLIVLLVLPFYSPFRSLFMLNINILYPTVIIIIAILGVMLLRLRTRFINTVSIALFFLILGAVNFTIIGSGPQVDFAGQQPPNQLFLTVVKSDAIIRNFDPKVQLRFWYANGEPQSGVYAVIASTRLWGNRLVNDRFPNIEEPNPAATKKEFVPIPPDTKIVILSDDIDAFEKASAAFERVGQHAEFLSEERIEQGSIKFNMTFIQVKED